MAKQITPEAFQYVVSIVSNLVHCCSSTASTDMCEGDISLGWVNRAFDEKGKILMETTKDWLDLLKIASEQVTEEFYKEYGLKK